MDQVKIGKFISNERKAKGYTQKQLSELLAISDKTISKWECGNGFPEASLLLPLCNELEITVNELLTGERISQQNYKKKKIGYFKCRNCNELFTPTFMQYNMGIHLLSTRYLKCPHCKTKTWCKKVMTKEC